VRRDRLDRSAETFALRDMMLGYVTRYPQPAADLFAQVRDDYGSVGDRRLWRCLAWLLASGKITRIDESGYTRNREAVETEAEAMARDRLELCADGLCYECRTPVETGPRCLRCFRANHAAAARRRYASAKQQGVSNG
jgi:hypothetical protein